MKDEWRMMKDEWRLMKDDDFKLLRGFEDEQTDGQTDEQTNGWMDICDCRVTFATENQLSVQCLKENMMIKDTLISIMQFLSCQFYIFHTSHTFIQ